MAVMQEAVEHSGDGRAVAEQFSPVLDWSVRRHQCARAFVTAHHDLQQRCFYTDTSGLFDAP
jgi:hypothetical protein